jgi:hypothetical protein
MATSADEAEGDITTRWAMHVDEVMQDNVQAISQKQAATRMTCRTGGHHIHPTVVDAMKVQPYLQRCQCSESKNNLVVGFRVALRISAMPM